MHEWAELFSSSYFLPYPVSWRAEGRVTKFFLQPAQLPSGEGRLGLRPPANFSSARNPFAATRRENPTGRVPIPEFASCAQMEPCSKRIREVGSSSTEDRLSALPDVLLHTILSSLKARQLVQTSVLSRRWRSLWRSVPCLHIDQGEFKSNPGRMSRREIQKFEDFGDFLLLRHDVPDLDSFCLHLTEDFLVNIDFARWLRRALKCSLKALRIHCFRSRQVQIPLDLGSSSHCLKRLHLSNVSLDKKKFEETINCVCVVLEELELKDCEVYVDSITSSSLRNLIVDDGFIHGHGMIIRTPRLASLDLILGMFNSPILLEEVSSLVKASICFKLHPDAVFHFDLLGLLSNLHNVTSLKLSGLIRMVMPDGEPVEFPTFKNLRSLLLDQCDLSAKFQLLSHFLQSSPNLEKLTVQFCKLPEGSTGEEGMAKLKKLRSTEIIYKDGDDIRELVCFLLHISDHVLKNAITLTKV